MNVRTFEAPTMKAAIRQVKQTFGSDAIILETKERTGADQARIFEVTASSRSSTEAKKVEGATGMTGLNVSRDELLSWHQKLESFDDRLGEIYEKTVKRSDLHRMEGALEEVRMLVVDYLSRKADAPFHKLPSSAAEIIKTLKIMRLNESCLNGLVRYFKSLAESAATSDREADLYESFAIKWLMKRTKIAAKWASSHSDQDIHVLVGPSGVGKTTSSAKIASALVSEKQSVVYISFDNQRLGVHEQARLYCKVLDVPFEKVGSADDLPHLLRKYQSFDSVIIDTGGCSPKNQEQIASLKRIRQFASRAKFHLVQSMTDQAAQLERSVRMFQSLGLESLIFTKMDESWFYGEVFNLMDKWGIPLSWFGTGSSVPADLEFASRERLVERLMGVTQL